MNNITTATFSNTWTGTLKPTTTALPDFDIYDRYHLNSSLDLLYGVVGMIASFVGIIGNSLTVSYFYARCRKLSSFLYFSIVVNDIVLCISAQPFMVSLLSERKPVLNNNVVICNMSGFLFNATSRISVFFIALFSSVRCFSLYYPFKRIKHSTILSIVSAYLLIQIVSASVPYMFHSTYKYRPVDAMCNWSIGKLVNNNRDYLYLPFLLFIAMPFLVPCVPILVSCCLSICCIVNVNSKNTTSKAHFDSNHDSCSQRKKDKATKTILMLTGLYILFNIPYWVYVILNLFYFAGVVDLTHWIRYEHGFYFVLFITPLSIVVNSAMNPVLYLTRIDTLRYSLKDKTKRLAGASSQVSSARRGTVNQTRSLKAVSLPCNGDDIGKSFIPLKRSRSIHGTTPFSHPQALGHGYRHQVQDTDSTAKYRRLLKEDKETFVAGENNDTVDELQTLGLTKSVRFNNSRHSMYC